MNAYDRRITPARADLAAAHLAGTVSAPRFAEGRVAHVAQGTANLRAEPRDDAALDTQLVFGERFTVYDEAHGWAWGQAAQDSYVGYVRADALAADAPVPTHRVSVPSTPLLPAATVMRPPSDMLPLNAKVAVAAMEDRFAHLQEGGYVFAGHLAPLAERTQDWVGVAERFLGVPYVFGGKTWAGIDCSGLIQAALEAGGIAAPRDADMMQHALGRALPCDLGGLRRGDIVFWSEHMGAMADDARLIHANSFHMQVVIEPLVEAVVRIAARGGAISAIKRL